MVPKVRTFAPRAPEDRLNSWKEIAAYLNRDPRTVQLWEKHEGLPVRRLTHTSRASVYASTSEIDAWLRNRSGQGGAAARLEAQADGSPDAPFWRSNLRLLFFSAMILAGLAAAGFWIAHSHARAPAGPILVVLPFENQTSSDNALMDGLADALVSDLGREPGLNVISRQSLSRLNGRKPSLHDLGVEFRASLALQGAVAQVGDQTSVTVELLDIPTESHVWGTTYTRKSSQMPGASQEIASLIAIAVASRVSAPVHGAESSPPVDARAVDPRVRQAYLDGRYYWNQRNLPALQKAIASFQQAIDADSRYAPAYAGLAGCYDLMTDRGVISDQEAFDRAKSAARTALALDPSNTRAYTALAFATYRQDWDFAGAESDFQKAIQLDPNDPVAHQWYGEFLGDLGRFDQSIAELRKSEALDPLTPMAGADLADGYIHAGRIADAQSELRRILELYPDFAPAHQYLAIAYAQSSDFIAARAEAVAYADASGDHSTLRWIEVRSEAAGGHLARARAIARSALQAGAPLAPDAYHSAAMLFASSQPDAAYIALEQALREHSWWLVTMLVDPAFQSVRIQQRFMALARQVGLPNASRAR